MYLTSIALIITIRLTNSRCKCFRLETIMSSHFLTITRRDGS